MKKNVGFPSHRSPCPVACALDLVGDKWTLVVVRDLFLGRNHFKEFQASPEGIATNILADRLAKLVGFGLAEKFPSPGNSGKPAYRLTKKGETLEPVVRAIATWGLEQIDGTEARLQKQ
ncbi:MAG: helix-turn-helix domain-containing protein [Verrucomicrobiota bacterium]